jgi:toxin ParE1/3/4
MTSQLIFRPEVRGDLLEIVRYLSTRSPRAAEHFPDNARRTLEFLTTMPNIGSLKHFRRKHLSGLRSWPVRGFPNHIIYYRPITSGIEVIAILHGARNIPVVLRHRK